MVPGGRVLLAAQRRLPAGLTCCSAAIATDATAARVRRCCHHCCCCGLLCLLQLVPAPVECSWGLHCHPGPAHRPRTSCQPQAAGGCQAPGSGQPAEVGWSAWAGPCMEFDLHATSEGRRCQLGSVCDVLYWLGSGLVHACNSPVPAQQLNLDTTDVTCHHLLQCCQHLMIALHCQLRATAPVHARCKLNPSRSVTTPTAAAHCPRCAQTRAHGSQACRWRCRRTGLLPPRGHEGCHARSSAS